MNEVTNYINKVLGIRVDYNKVAPKKLKNLPLFIVKSYDFGEIKLFNQSVILLFVKGEFTTEMLRTHLNIIRSALNAIIVPVLPTVDSYKRLRLIDKKIPFIIPEKQMFLPDLLISLKEYGNTKSDYKQPGKMQPAAQLILLYHMQVDSLEGLNFGKIADKLGYNPMTITRAAYYFQNMGLCNIEGKKEKFLKFNKTKRELWDATEPEMINPIYKYQFYTGLSLKKSLKKTNINALAFYTDLNNDQTEYLAMRHGLWKFIEGVNLRPADPLEANICIEEWKYDPGILSKTEYVDPLSLYLCFRENKNDRIEMALEKLLKQIQW
ncbi:MAG: hypothetical protein JXK07_12110 [Spirochaetes bacterium]|nr:hypothetical protein [Spirochaetota bacterium]